MIDSSTKPSANNGDKVLLMLVGLMFLWFFASSLSIAYSKSLHTDGAMFASIPKNFLNGDGWATIYGEKIPFNPDVSTGPTLLIPTAIMLKLFGTQVWVPAMTATISNIFLTLLVLWQLISLSKFRASACLALLLAISLFHVPNFKILSGYYTGILLFLFALFFSINKQYSPNKRLLLFGFLAAVGLYGKPLILMSFLLALPLVIVFINTTTEKKEKNIKHYFRAFVLVLLGFVVTLLPWHIYKTVTLSKYPADFQQAYKTYDKHFFENHGTGIGQFKRADNKIVYLKKNAKKNFRILKKFLIKENNFPFVFIIILLLASFSIALKRAGEGGKLSNEEIILTLLSWVVVGNLAWYVGFSFAMTPGHAFFLTFFAFFLLFYFVASQSRSTAMGLTLCCLLALLFSPRHAQLIEAYTFKAENKVVSNKDLIETVNFIEQNDFNSPLAFCGYGGASRNLRYLLPNKIKIVDCYHVFEDSLALDEAHYFANNPSIDFASTGNKKTFNPSEHFFTQGKHREVQAQFHWARPVNLTYALELGRVVMASRAEKIIFSALAKECEKHLLFSNQSFYVCEVPFDKIKNELDPTNTARSLADYQSWYKTRLKTY